MEIGDRNETVMCRFGVMILVSTVVMFGMMYLNVFQWDHIFYSQTRIIYGVDDGGRDGDDHALIYVENVRK